MEKLSELTEEQLDKLSNDKINKIIIDQIFLKKPKCLNYSRDVKHAFELVSLLDSYRWVINTGDEMGTRDGKKYEVQVVAYLGMGSFDQRKVREDSLPRAICLAALKMHKRL